MQTTQGQPPPYTLPVVQPHLAPPTPPNVRVGYKSYSVTRLAIIQIILGGFSFAFQLWDRINDSELSVVGTGIWCGMIFIFTGCLGLYSANQKTVCSIVSYMVMSLFSCLFAMGLLSVSAVNLDYYKKCIYYSEPYTCELTDYMRTSTIFLCSMLVLIAVVEGIMAIVAASFACHGCCCSTPNHGFYSSAPTQYVQGPDGQLLLVTEQQPQLVTTTTGQQVPVTANTGGCQPLELPAQGSYQLTTQPHIVTVPTQPPMPQADPVQQQAYQAAAEHQTVTSSKTNMTYVDM